MQDLTKKFSNAHISQMFKEIASAYQILGKSFFRTRAYQNASSIIGSLSSDVKSLWEESGLDSIQGLGDTTKSYLDEYFRTGHIVHFDTVKSQMPPGMFVLLDIPGIGPKTAYRLSKELGITSREDLIKACKQEAVANLTGFGEKSQSDILKSAQTPRVKKDRTLLNVAEDIALSYQKFILEDPNTVSCDFLGSLRRKASTVGDIDFSVATTNPVAVINKFVLYPQVEQVEDKGDKKASVILKTGQRVDLMTGDPASYGALLAHLTGSKLHNIALRTYAQTKGLSISEYGIKDQTDVLKTFPSEELFYKYLGLDFIPPELREDRGEIDYAKAKPLPKLIDQPDMRGDLQMHSTYSDGANTIAEMAQKGFKLEYEYLGITDHSLSLNTKTKQEILSIIKAQKHEIAQLKYSKDDFKVLLGTECNILSNGELSLSDEILQEYDYAIASIHTGFDQSKEQITQRLINAIINPSINFIAHPTGRVLLERDPYDVDWRKIFNYCIQYNKPLEINAFPSRLDLPDDLVKIAKDMGVKFVINTDAHSTVHLDYMKYGVYVARRGWCTKEEILNTLSLKGLVKILKIRNQD
ncbi:DNA polymerase/3'-5' exonuclease PolX [Candidatus Parcubacteria bacterium]|nr:DNA polymerase/3'-5' exonuclease PolX [Patescibacteria group bacterium]MBU4380879.1 DNA polymerase/3'-5' exonuclease PolX [Patescibacteria group bacterium]MCG2688930.1 DNA polymerase/3'-5' exonuclease PolX [Candidatus Parcubacteria bacterium]